MRKVALFSLLLVAGLAGSQLLPFLGSGPYRIVSQTADVLTLIGLAFIMIHVGYEFEIDKSWFVKKLLRGVPAEWNERAR